MFGRRRSSEPSHWLNSMWFVVRFAVYLYVAANVTTPAQAAGKRLALPIGNAGYDKAVGLLKNPHKDVVLLASALSRIDFEATIAKDATYRTLDVEEAYPAGAVGQHLPESYVLVLFPVSGRDAAQCPRPEYPPPALVLR